VTFKPLAFNWKSVAAYPLVTFFVGNDTYTYFGGGGLSKWDSSRRTATAQSPGKIPNVDRVIFHDNTAASDPGAFLIGFNVVGQGNFSQAEFKHGSLVIFTSIRCLLQGHLNDHDDGKIGEAVSIKARFDNERLLNLWISHSLLIDESGQASVDLLQPDSGSRAQKPLKQALADLAAGRTPPPNLGKRQSAIDLGDANVYSEVYTAWSNMLRGLLNRHPGKQTIEGNTLPDHLPTEVDSDFDGLTVTVREQQRQNQDEPPVRYLIEFEASFVNPSDLDLKCFGIGPSGDASESENTREARAQFELAENKNWYFRQRSSVASCFVASRQELDDVAEWTLELQSLAQGSTADHLSYWTACAVKGIQQYSGATAASFIPNLDIPGQDGGSVFSAVYQIADRVRDRSTIDAKLYASKTAEDHKTVVRPMSVQYIGHRPKGKSEDEGHESNLSFPLCNTTGRKALRMTAFLTSDTFSNRDSLEGFNFATSYALYEAALTQSVRMGSLELAFGTRGSLRGGQQVYFRLPPSLSISINAAFVLTGMLPGGQDDLPEDSLAAPNADVLELPVCRTGILPPAATDAQKLNAEIEKVFYRPKPLLINRNNASNAPLLFYANEQAGPGINRTVQLAVGVDTVPAPPLKTALQQTIVIDEDPFLVAQISFPQLLSQGSSNQIAVWNAAGDSGGKWQIPLTRSGFGLSLPSQIMGEEMIKGLPQDFPSFPIDFRMGPPAVMAMESGPQLTAYAEVPWNLRRILGYASQTAPGVRISRLDYELLYGLSCDASLPWVRLAEVLAVFGAIPGRLPQSLATADPAFGMDAATHYAQWRTEWAKLYRRYQARLAVLEPQDSHVAGSATIKHGMSCLIRYKADDAQKNCSQTLGKALPQFAPDDSTAGHPYRLPYADLEDPISPGPRGAHLRGGVTWGFESRNIFCATLRNEFSTQDSAAASDLDLTALGGYGHQQASFDEGRTAIFGDSTLGRTYYYKLERVGRIAVFWNKAKHVIVYERSVVPSRQFFLEQNPAVSPTASYGIPMLRKVEEYVEILEEERRFPDDHVLANVPPVGNQTPEQRCGCVAGCVFQKGARIRVSSAWGCDVNSFNNGNQTPIGWKVPLWKRGALPEDIYPFPKISLSLFSDFAGSSKESPCDVANPEGVYFYTDTRENSGSDTDKWDAVIGVDTVDMPLTKPVLLAATSVLPTIGDAPVPAGFSACTFQLLPPLRAANIVANRVSTAMAVALDTVTMMRGCVPKPVAGPALDLTQVIETYSGSWDRELKILTSTDWTKARLITAISNVSGDVNGALDTAKGTISTQWKNIWTKQVKTLNTSALDQLSNQLQTGTSNGTSIAGGIRQVEADVTAALASITASTDPTSILQQLVEEQFGAIQKTVLNASATPGVLTTLLAQYYGAANGIVNKAATGIQQLKSALTNLPPEARDAVAQLTKQVLDLRSDLTSTWTAAASAHPIPAMADIADGLIRPLSQNPPDSGGPLQIFGNQYTALIKTLADCVVSQKTDYAGKLQDLRNNVAHLAAFDTSVSTELDKFTKLLKAGYSGNFSGALTYLDFFRNDMTFIDPTSALSTWAGGVHKSLIDAIGNGGTQAIQRVQKAFADTFNSFNSKISDLQHALTDEVATLDSVGTAIGQSVTNALNSVKADASTTLRNLRDSMIAALQNLPDSAVTPQQIADMQQAVLRFRDAQLAEAHQYVDKYLGLFRTYNSDITSSTNQVLSLVRAFGDAPVADTLSFLPGKVGYYFQDLSSQVDLSPVTSILRHAGNVANDASGILNDALNVMHLQVPAMSLADRLVPPDLSGLKLSDIFPKFAGLDLSHLFQDINLNENGDKIHISHGTDPQTTSAWVQANIGAHLEDVPVFETGGVSLRLKTADFAGQVRIDVSPQGTRQAATGNVLGDWTLLVLGQPAVTLAATQLVFDSSGKLQFKVDPKNVQLPGVLSFVTQYLAPFLGGGNGLSIRVEGTQVLALLNLPIPDVSGLTSGISNLTLSCKFAVGLVGGQFQLDVGFGLSDPQKPFNIAFFILGGAGYLTATTRFIPASNQPPSCTVNFGIMASASLAIAFGPISGGVYAFLGIRAGFSTGGPGLNLTAVLLLRGQVNLAGIVSASVCMELSATYDGHQLTGTGSFSISITICWCFTLNISVGISYPIGSFGGQSLARVRNVEMNPMLLASLEPGGFNPDASGAPPIADELAQLVGDYVAMTEGF